METDDPENITYAIRSESILLYEQELSQEKQRKVAGDME
jgi:hypothetical protein